MEIPIGLIIGIFISFLAMFLARTLLWAAEDTIKVERGQLQEALAANTTKVKQQFQAL